MVPVVPKTGKVVGEIGTRARCFCKKWYQWYQNSIKVVPAHAKLVPLVPKPMRNQKRTAPIATASTETNSAKDDPFGDRVNRFKPSIPRKGRLGGMVWNQSKLGKTSSSVSPETTTAMLS